MNLWNEEFAYLLEICASKAKAAASFTGAFGQFLCHCLHAGALFWNHECRAQQNGGALKGRLRRQHLWMTLLKILHRQRLNFGLCAKQRNIY